MNKKDVVHVAKIIVFLSIWLFGLVAVIVFERLPYGYEKRTGSNGIYIDHQNINFAGFLTSIASDGDYIYCCFGKRFFVKVYDTVYFNHCSFKRRQSAALSICWRKRQSGCMLCIKV